MQNNNVEIFFPGFTKKSVTFTIDDGNIKYDEKFLSIVRPAGIKGTFNLCMPTKLTPEKYREMYQGYEIANHCKFHPELFRKDKVYIISDEKFDPLTSSRYTDETPYVYKFDGEDGLYLIHARKVDSRPDGWIKLATEQTYMRLVGESHDDLEEVFGKGSIKSYVWPFGDQKNPEIQAALMERGYNSVRKTGLVEHFDLPSDRSAWSYNAREGRLLSKMEEYESLSDDGKLKFFAFGIHSIDYERADAWPELREFAAKYGNRPEEFYYASVSDIFEYEDAVKALAVTDTEIINNSDKEIYLKVRGERMTVAPKSKITI
ncbi:MAG: hypothetical protein J6V09_02470 [Clostridia bacterium]|nr:hypothetical protein [Clostridia bacterium]